MIDGYAFIPEYTAQAIPVINDEITYSQIVKRGWCSPPVRILSDPSTASPSNEHIPWFKSVEEIEKEVALGRAFKYEGRYYLHHGSVSYVQPTNSEYENPYWKEGGSVDSSVVELITSALSAPLLPREWKPYKFHHLTTGVVRERVDMTVWATPGIDQDDVVERTSLPGIGYRYAPNGAIYIDEPSEDKWPSKAIATAIESRTFSIYISFPNCVVGPTTCARFGLVCETERELVGVGDHGINIFATKYTSCRLRFERFVTPRDYRRIPMPRFQPRSATDAVSCYVMNRSEVRSFISKLYTKDIYDKVKSMLYGDGAGNLLSLKWFYGVRPAITTPQKRKITLGNVTFNDLSVPVFAGDFTQIYMGYGYVGRVFSDYRDYTNLRVQAYIPMVGLIDLEPSKVVGTFVHLFYTINLTDGSAIVTLSTSGSTPQKTNGWYEIDNIIFTTSITYGYEIPLNVESIRSPSLMVGDVITRAVAGGAVGAIAGNIPGAVLGAVGGAASSVNQIESAYSVGSLTPNSNVMGDFTPKIYRIYHDDASGDISNAVGRPSGKVVKVGDASGYLKAAMVYGTPSTTMQHTDEIINMLKEGIYIS